MNEIFAQTFVSTLTNVRTKLVELIHPRMLLIAKVLTIKLCLIFI